MTAWAGWASNAWAGTAWAGTTSTVPNVVGLAEASAITAIEAEWLVASVSYEYSESVSSGDVISQNPAASSEVSTGSTVYIVVSLGVSTGGGILQFQRRRGRR